MCSSVTILPHLNCRLPLPVLSLDELAAEESADVLLTNDSASARVPNIPLTNDSVSARVPRVVSAGVGPNLLLLYKAASVWCVFNRQPSAGDVYPFADH